MLRFSDASRAMVRFQRWALPLFAILLLSISTLAAPALATSVSQMPALSAGDGDWILDEAGILSRVSSGQIKSRLKKMSEVTESEVHFVTFRRLDYGETIESFTQDLFQTSFPTAAEQANQVLLVIDVATNTVAVKAGAEAQKRLTDDIALSIAEETMMAPIRQGDQYNQAFLNASDRLVAVLSGKTDPGPPLIEDDLRVEGTFASAEETQQSNATVIVIVLLILATVIPMVTYYAYVR